MAESAEWEPVNDTGVEDTERLRVPGGWLYRVQKWKRDGDENWQFLAMSVVFVPEQKS